MKIKALLLLMLVPISLTCNEWLDNFTNLVGEDMFRGWRIEARAACYNFKSNIMREIYGGERWEPQIQLQKSLGCLPADFWLNVGYFRKRGGSLGLDQFTRIRIQPVSFGLNGVVPLNYWMKINLGIGAHYAHVNIFDDSPFVDRHTRKSSWGCILKSSVIYDVTNCVYFSVFADYLFQRFKNHGFENGVYKTNINIDGWKFGAGIGIKY